MVLPLPVMPHTRKCFTASVTGRSRNAQNTAVSSNCSAEQRGGWWGSSKGGASSAANRSQNDWPSGAGGDGSANRPQKLPPDLDGGSLNPSPPFVLAADTRRGISLAERLELDEALALLRVVAPPCVDYLWGFYVLGWTDQELAQEHGTSEAAMRMRRQRCLRLALKLVTKKDSTHG